MASWQTFRPFFDSVGCLSLSLPSLALPTYGGSTYHDADSSWGSNYVSHGSILQVSGAVTDLFYLDASLPIQVPGSLVPNDTKSIKDRLNPLFDCKRMDGT